MFTVFSGYTVYPAGVSEAAINETTAHIFVTEEQGCSKSAAQSRETALTTHRSHVRAHTHTQLSDHHCEVKRRVITDDSETKKANIYTLGQCILKYFCRREIDLYLCMSLLCPHLQLMWQHARRNVFLYALDLSYVSVWEGG